MDITRSTARLILALAVLVPFAGYSFWVVGQEGYLGFVDLALREPWGAQILVDLVISLVLVLVAVQRDARARGLPFWPYAVLAVPAGSIAVLAYVVHRELVGVGASQRGAAGTPRT